MNGRKIMRGILWAVFVIYACVVLGILFFETRSGRFPYGSVWEYIRYSVNLIPFKTIWGYAMDVMTKPWMLGIAIRNVLGNLVLFYPMGIFLSCLFSRIRTLKQTVLISLCTILSVECIQLIFRRGVFDIDDLILNMAGWMLGFLTFSIPFVRRLLKKMSILNENEILTERED